MARSKPSPPKPAGGSRPRARALSQSSSQTSHRLVRGKLWIEAVGKAILTESGADLLEQIEACGSLSEAARRLRFAYRRAWLLVDAMNRGWPTPLVTTATGGRKGGGTQITEQGRHVLRNYRDLQLQLELLLDGAAKPFDSVP